MTERVLYGFRCVPEGPETSRCQRLALEGFVPGSYGVSTFYLQVLARLLGYR